MSVTKERPAPYATAKTITDVIDRYRHRGLLTPVNAEVLGRAGVPNSLIPRTIQTLQTLDLIDEEGKPTSTFEALRLAPESDFKQRLAEWLKGAYAEVFTFVDPTQDDETRIRDAFRSYQPIGQQSRMVSLFQGLCTAAGLTNVASATAGPRSAPRPAPTSSGKRATPKPTPKPNFGGTVTFTGVPTPVSALLGSLPTGGQGWTQERRDKFLLTLGSLLDFYIPIVSDEEKREAAE